MSKLQELFKKYGKIGIGVHLSIYAATLAGCYFATQNKLKLEHYLIDYGLLTEKDLKADANPEERSWIAKAVTSGGSSFAIAFLCTKALLPVRVPLTIGLTPVVARILHPRIAAQAQQEASQQIKQASKKF